MIQIILPSFATSSLRPQLVYGEGPVNRLLDRPTHHVATQVARRRLRRCLHCVSILRRRSLLPRWRRWTTTPVILSSCRSHCPRDTVPSRSLPERAWLPLRECRRSHGRKTWNRCKLDQPPYSRASFFAGRTGNRF